MQILKGRDREEVDMSVRSAAATGRRELLVAMRDTIASTIDDGPPARDLAALSRRLLEVMSELDALAEQEDGDAITDAASLKPESFAPSGGAASRTA